MTLLFIILDTIIRGGVVVGIYFIGRYFIREASQGFPSLNDPNHRYADEDLKKSCGCDIDFNCYCEHYEQYK
jgi:hypothetical protein